jgi:hypothetical protein
MSKPKGVITPEKAKELNDAFNTRCALVSKDITKRPDNRSSWWSLEDIRHYLDYAENQARELGHEMNGIRIYCGAYPNEKGKAGYSTSFIVPTAKIIDGKDVALKTNSDIAEANPLNEGGHGWPPYASYPQG